MSAIHRLPMQQPHQLAPVVNDFGTVLRRYRLHRGLSQNALAHHVGINASYINRLESGERTAPTRQVACALARALHLATEDTDQLLFSAGHVPPTLQKLGATDSTVMALVGALTCDRIAPEDRANLRAMVEVLCAQWQKTAQNGPKTNGRQL